MILYHVHFWYLRDLDNKESTNKKQKVLATPGSQYRSQVRNIIISNNKDL